VRRRSKSLPPKPVLPRSQSAVSRQQGCIRGNAEGALRQMGVNLEPSRLDGDESGADSVAHR
jgi:hypothetical protein